MTLRDKNEIRISRDISLTWIATLCDKDIYVKDASYDEVRKIINVIDLFMSQWLTQGGNK